MMYYVPYVSQFAQLWNGATLQPYNFCSSLGDTAGLSLNMAGSANWPTGSAHDLFVTLNGGVPTLATVQWTTVLPPARSIGLVSSAVLDQRLQRHDANQSDHSRFRSHPTKEPFLVVCTYTATEPPHSPMGMRHREGCAPNSTFATTTIRSVSNHRHRHRRSPTPTPGSHQASQGRHRQRHNLFSSGTSSGRQLSNTPGDDQRGGD